MESLRLPYYIGISKFDLLPRLVIENPGWEFKIAHPSHIFDGFTKASVLFPYLKDKRIRYYIHCKKVVISQ